MISLNLFYLSIPCSIDGVATTNTTTRFVRNKLLLLRQHLWRAISEFQNAELLIGYATLCSALINERGVSPLLPFLHELGDWPVLQPSWNESGYDVTELVAKINKLGENALWDEWVSADGRNSDSNIIQVSLIFVFQSFQSISWIVWLIWCVSLYLV